MSVFAFFPSMNIKKLTDTEALVLRLLAKGYRYLQIAHQLKIHKMNVHSIVYRIRRKTGIKNTKDCDECVNYLHGIRSYPNAQGATCAPTRQQVHAMSLVAKGYDYPQIARIMELNSGQTVQNYVSQGCERAGITAKGILRPKAIGEYLATLNAIHVKTAPRVECDPMDNF